MVPAQTSTSAGAVALPGNEHALAEANTFNTSQLEYPLTRTVSDPRENDLCLRKTASVWAPNSTVKSIPGTRSLESLKTTQRVYPRLTNSPFARPRSASTPTSPAVPKSRRSQEHCPAQAYAVGAEVVLPDGARPVDHRRRRLTFSVTGDRTLRSRCRMRTRTRRACCRRTTRLGCAARIQPPFLRLQLLTTAPMCAQPTSL